MFYKFADGSVRDIERVVGHDVNHAYNGFTVIVELVGGGEYRSTTKDEELYKKIQKVIDAYKKLEVRKAISESDPA